MNILIVAYYAGIKYLRNIIFLLFFIISPLLIIIIATTEGSGTSISENEIPKEKVGFRIEDSGAIGEQFDAILGSSDIKNSLDTYGVNSLEDGLGQIKDGKLNSFIYASGGITDGINEGKKQYISVYSIGGTSAARMLAEGMVNRFNSARTVLEYGGSPQESGTWDNLDISLIDTKDLIPSAKEGTYFAILLLFFYYGAFLGSNTIISDRNKNTAHRLKCAPVRAYEVMLGKSAGNVTVLFLVTAIVLTLAHFVLNTGLSVNIPVVMAVMLLYLIIINNTGMILACFIKNIYICGIAIFAMNFTFVSNVMTQAFNPEASGSLSALNLISPHYYAFQTMIGSINGHITAGVPESIIALVVYAFISAGILAVSGRRLAR